MNQKYMEQIIKWPNQGKHILAKYDDNTISVYQAYNKSIADFAIKNQYFGDSFSYSRMSWIKPNFLWMMYRCGWASKEGQEVVLEVQISKTFFEEILKAAVLSTYDPEKFKTTEDWKNAINNSDVRLQWDPDHDPKGIPVIRKAMQIGLRGNMLERYGKKEIVKIIDITNFVKEQSEKSLDDMIIPEEKIYTPADIKAGLNIGIDKNF